MRFNVFIVCQVGILVFQPLKVRLSFNVCRILYYSPPQNDTFAILVLTFASTGSVKLSHMYWRNSFFLGNWNYGCSLQRTSRIHYISSHQTFIYYTCVCL